MAKPGHVGIRRILLAAGYSLRGLAAAWRHESAFRQECLLFLAGTLLALWLGDGVVERLLLIGSLGLVLVVELLNSALEATVDRIDAADHPLSARAKDMGSAAVLLSLLLAGLVWLLVLWP